jgi:TPP-dependent pyruvate/acetoin dehydrogenase alpha subunit
MKLNNDQKIKLYSNMVRCRKLDELLLGSYTAGKIPVVYHSGQGQEAIGVGTATFLRKDDFIFFTHRGEGVLEAIPRGLPVKKYLATIYGKKGNGLAFPEVGMFGMSGTVGGDLTVGSGLAFAAKHNGRGQVVVQFFGDGATGRGSFHTSLLMSVYWNLPIIWICSNNNIAMWTPTNKTNRKENLADLVFGYDMPSEIVDGQDVEAVYYAAKSAIDRARGGGGPSFIECKTNRFRPHSEGMEDISQTGLRDRREIENWITNKDPIKLYQSKLKKEGVLTRSDITRIDKEVKAELGEADRYASELPIPTSNLANLEKSVYVD